MAKSEPQPPLTKKRFEEILRKAAQPISEKTPDSKGTILSHKFANLIEYAPRCFVGDTQFPLELLGGNACFGGSHQEYSMKPRAERGIRLVEDSTRSRRYMTTTELAGVDFAGSYSVMGSYFLTLLAIDSLRVAGLLKELKASIFIRELFAKIFDSVGFHISFSNLTLYLHYSTNNPCCQGI